MAEIDKRIFAFSYKNDTLCVSEVQCEIFVHIVWEQLLFKTNAYASQTKIDKVHPFIFLVFLFGCQMYLENE